MVPVLLMEEILHHLRLVVYHIMYVFFYIPGGTGFLPSTPITSGLPPPKRFQAILLQDLGGLVLNLPENQGFSGVIHQGWFQNPAPPPPRMIDDEYPIIYRVFSPSQVVGLGISEPSTVFLPTQTSCTILHGEVPKKNTIDVCVV